MMRRLAGCVLALVSLATLDQAQPAEVVLWHAYRGGERTALPHLYQHVHVGAPMPSAAAMADIWGPAATAMTKITTGRASPAKALGEAHAAIAR